MAIYYHGSEFKELSVIKPNISTHGKKYIYAAKYRNIALLFLSRWNDFLMTLETNVVNDKLEIVLIERHENIIRDIYSEKTGVIYKIDSENFRQEKNMWEFEYISEQEETPISSEVINNIIDEINILNNKNEIKIYFYPNRPSNIPKDDFDMVKKTVELYRLSGDKYNATYCIKKFPKLKEKILKAFINEFNIDLCGVG